MDWVGTGFAIIVFAVFVGLVILIYALLVRRLNKSHSFFEKLKGSLGGELYGRKGLFDTKTPLPKDCEFGLVGSRSRIGYRIDLAETGGRGRRLAVRISVDFKGKPSSRLTYYGKSNIFEGTAKGLYGERRGEFFIKSEDMVWANGFFDRNEEQLKILSGLAAWIGIESGTLRFWPREENSDKVIEALDIAIEIVKRESKK